jgi:hypothetical protein
MLFYALRVVCPKCSVAVLLGGGADYDLTRWRRSTVSCVRCDLEIAAADAPAVPLRSASDVHQAVKSMSTTSSHLYG